MPVENQQYGEKNSMPKKSESAIVISQESLSEGIYSMWIETSLATYANPGQFISIYTKNEAKLLPRPISICEIEEGKLRIVYRVMGDGTGEFATYKAGDTIKIMGPLGNGFFGALEAVNCEETAKKVEITNSVKALLIGGGIGIPPMLELAKRLPCDVTIVSGYRNDKSLFLTEELSQEGKLIVATDDGSFGTNGTVIDAIRENSVEADIIFACGPKPMLKGVKELAVKWGIPAFISMEERMACGIGACLGCVCKSTETDSHSNVKNKRVCVDGPVFLASEVEL